MRLTPALFVALVLAFAPSASWAAAYEIYTYGNTDMYRDVFNAVAGIFQGSDFRVVTKIVLMGAFMIALVTTAIVKLPAFLTWFIQAIMFFFILNVPIATVTIVDRMNGSPVQVVDNVPVALAATAELTTRIGDWLTRKFETAMSVPDEMKVSKRGLRFGQKTLAYSAAAEVRNGELQNDMALFFRNCVLPEITSGQLNIDELLCSSTGDDPWEVMWSRVNPGRITTVKTMSDQLTTSCQCAATGCTPPELDSVTTAQSLKSRVEAEVTGNLQLLGRMLFPDESNSALAGTKMTNALDVARTSILQYTGTAGGVINRAMFANVWRQTGGNRVGCRDG